MEPTSQAGRHVHDAVDLGGLAVRAADAGLVDEDRHRATDQVVAPGRGDVVLHAPQLEEPLGDQAGGHGAVEVGRVGAVLLRVGEEAAPVELGLLDEVEQGVVVGLGLARVADDEVGPEHGVGLDGRGWRRCARGSVAPSPQRRMRRTSGRDTCCSDRSKYGTPVRRMASIRPSVSSDGYR